MTLEQMRAKLEALVAQINGVHAKAEAEQRVLTPDELKQLGELDAEAKTLQGNINARAARESINQQMTAVNQRRSSPGVSGIAVGGSPLARDPLGGFASFSQFCRDVRAASNGAGMSDRLRAWRGVTPEILGAAPTTFQNESVGSDGGFLVPPQVSQEIYELLFDGTDIVNEVAMEPTSSNAIKWGADETTPWGATGVKAVWAREAQQQGVTGKISSDQRLTELHKLYAFCAATDEVVSDAPLLESRLTRSAAAALRWELSEQIMWGDGVGKPAGFMTSGGIISQAKEIGQATATIVMANAIKMLTRMWLMGRRSVKWYANIDTLPQLASMTLGNNGVFFLPQNGILGTVPATLLGLPLDFSEHNKTVGTFGDLVLTDIKAGYMGAQHNSGVKYATSIHLWFDTGQQAFRWEMRVAGRPMLSAPVSPKNGTNTRSHFVGLADRP